MTRQLAALLVLAAASPAAAATYSAKPAAPVSDRFITRDIVWNCDPSGCKGSTEASRPLVLCQSLARRAGRIESFAADGRALEPQELERCNSVAGGAPASALATAR